jgi:chemotaxis methyl-accepting protein methylase
MFFQWDELGYEGAFERQARPGGSCRFVCGDAFDSRVAPGPFDVIFSWRTLQGFDDRELGEILRSMDARLSSFGLLFITGQNAARSTMRISDELTAMSYDVNPRMERKDVKTAWVLIASG